MAIFLVGLGSNTVFAADPINCDNAPQVATLNPFPLKFQDTEICRDYPVVAAKIVNGAWPQNITELVNGINAQAGDEIVVRIYVHNGAIANGNPSITTARNIKVKTTLDGSVGSFHSISVIAGSDNTNTIQGNFNIHTGPNDRLTIIPGSGQRLNYFANVIASGLNIANTTFNLGDMQACFEFSQFLIFRVKVETNAPVLQPSGQITAQPNPCAIINAGGTCVSNVTWTTANVTRAQVWVSQTNGPEKLFTDQISCSGTSCPAPWIQGPPNFYDFNLYDYSSGTRGAKLDSVRVTATVNITPTEKTLTVDLTAAANSVNFLQALTGTAPLNGVDFKADVGGTAAGTINYTFYCSRSDAGTNIFEGFNGKFDNTNENPKIVNDLCNYPLGGTFVAKVIAERGGLVAEDRVTITVNTIVINPFVTCSPSNQNVNINQVANFSASGGNGTFSWSAPGGTNSSGSGPNFTAGYSSSGIQTVTVTSAGQSSVCMVNVAQTASQPPTVDLKVNGFDGQITINYNTSAILTWASNNATSCNATANPSSNTWSGPKVVNSSTGESTGGLTQNIVFSIVCTGTGGSASDNVTVLVNPTTYYNPPQYYPPQTYYPPLYNPPQYYSAPTYYPPLYNPPQYYPQPTYYPPLYNPPQYYPSQTYYPPLYNPPVATSNYTMSVQKFGKNITRGENADQSSVNANPGDTIEFVIRVKSLSSYTIYNVIIQDILPGGLNYLYRTTSVDKTIISDGIIGGINIGSLNANQEKVIRLNVQVANQSYFSSGTISLINTAQVRADNAPLISAQLPINIGRVNVSTTNVISKVPTGGETIFVAALISAILSLALIFYGQTYFAQKREISRIIIRHAKDKDKFNFAA